MIWYASIQKKAEWGHGNTLEGQYMARFYRDLKNDIVSLRTKAYHGGPEDVLPRWKGDIRRRILLLPPEERIARMSMYEMKDLRDRVDDIVKNMNRYSQKRFTEIFSADHS